MITIKNLSKIFQTEEVETKALNEVSITINQGDFVTIMGASGSGKSTLLNIVGLLDSASSGSYHLLKQEMIGLKEQQRSKIRKENIGFVFQNFNLIDELSVYDNIELPLIYNNVNASERKQKIEKMAERLGISHRLKHYPQQLSGGQQQRVAVARALINDPKIILADEISPDTCRLWDAVTNEKMDKDRFRRDLGNVEETYQEVLSRVQKKG